MTLPAFPSVLKPSPAALQLRACVHQWQRAPWINSRTTPRQYLHSDSHLLYIGTTATSEAKKLAQRQGFQWSTYPFRIILLIFYFIYLFRRRECQRANITPVQLGYPT